MMTSMWNGLFTTEKVEPLDYDVIVAGEKYQCAEITWRGGVCQVQVSGYRGTAQSKEYVLDKLKEPVSHAVIIRPNQPQMPVADLSARMNDEGQIILDFTVVNDEQPST